MVLHESLDLKWFMHSPSSHPWARWGQFGGCELVQAICGRGEPHRLVDLLLWDDCGFGGRGGGSCWMRRHPSNSCKMGSYMKETLSLPKPHLGQRLYYSSPLSTRMALAFALPKRGTVCKYMPSWCINHYEKSKSFPAIHPSNCALKFYIFF